MDLSPDVQAAQAFCLAGIGDMERKRTVYLADLTHKGLVLSSNVFPLSIGLVRAIC